MFNSLKGLIGKAVTSLWVGGWRTYAVGVAMVVWAVYGWNNHLIDPVTAQSKIMEGFAIIFGRASIEKLMVLMASK